MRLQKHFNVFALFNILILNNIFATDIEIPFGVLDPPSASVSEVPSVDVSKLGYILNVTSEKGAEKIVLKYDGEKRLLTGSANVVGESLFRLSWVGGQGIEKPIAEVLKDVPPGERILRPFPKVELGWLDLAIDYSGLEEILTRQSESIGFVWAYACVPLESAGSLRLVGGGRDNKVSREIGIRIVNAQPGKYILFFRGRPNSRDKGGGEVFVRISAELSKNANRLNGVLEKVDLSKIITFEATIREPQERLLVREIGNLIDP